MQRVRTYALLHSDILTGFADTSMYLCETATEIMHLPFQIQS